MKFKLVSHWRLWWRRWSTWLAGIAGIVVSQILADPNAIAALNALVSGDDRKFKAALIGVAVAALIGVAVAALPVLITHLRQPALQEKRDGE